MSLEVKDKRAIPFTLIDNPILENEELSGTAKLVYALLCKYANADTGQCYPSHQTLSKLAGVSKPTLIKALGQLESAQYISIKKRTEGNQRLTNLYTILGTGGSKAALPGVVKEIDQGSKASLLGVVKPVYQGSKAALHELYPSNYIQENKIQLTILEHWNSKGIVEHRKLNKQTLGRINGKLEHYTPEEIMRAIDNYKRILDNPGKFWLSYRWQLWEFLDRGMEKMLNWATAETCYSKGNPGGGSQAKRYTHQRDESELAEAVRRKTLNLDGGEDP